MTQLKVVREDSIDTIDTLANDYAWSDELVKRVKRVIDREIKEGFISGASYANKDFQYEIDDLKLELKKATSDHCMDVFIPIEKYEIMQSEIKRLKEEFRRERTERRDMWNNRCYWRVRAGKARREF